MQTQTTQFMFDLIKEDLAPWFGGETPILDSLLWGCAFTDAYTYSLIYYVNLQTRVKTATGINLDFISQDFFGYTLPRKSNESDASFRNRILANLVQTKATRISLIQVLTKLTGRVPFVMDSMSSDGIGAYDQTLFYDCYGGYGIDAAYTGIIYAFRPQPSGFYFVGGYDSSFGDQNSGFSFGYDANFNNAYTGPVSEIEFVTDQDIIDAVENTKVYGTKIYLTIFD